MCAACVMHSAYFYLANLFRENILPNKNRRICIRLCPIPQLLSAVYLLSTALINFIINPQHLPVPRIKISGNPSAKLVRLSIFISLASAVLANLPDVNFNYALAGLALCLLA